MTKYFDYNTEGNKTQSIKVEVKYSKGGFNGFTGGQEQRGIWLYICPVTLEKMKLGEMDYVSERYVAFSGNKVCLKELSRRSDKQLNELVSKVEPVAERLAVLFRENKFAELNTEVSQMIAS